MYSDCPNGWIHNSQYDLCYSVAPSLVYLKAVEYCSQFGQSGQMAFGGSRDEAVMLRWTIDISSYYQMGCFGYYWPEPMCTNHYGQLLLDYLHVDLRSPRYAGGGAKPYMLPADKMNLAQLGDLTRYAPSPSSCRVPSPQIDGMFFLTSSYLI